jgi:hypothetical protein
VVKPALGHVEKLGKTKEIWKRQIRKKHGLQFREREALEAFQADHALVADFHHRAEDHFLESQE